MTRAAHRAWPVVAVLLAAAGCRDPSRQTTEAARFDAAGARYTGRESCAGCHPRESERWRGSHHDLAMQEASAESVLGDFDGASFTYFGTTSTFFRRDDRFIVRTDGADGELAEFEIVHTFGVEPLQQYLIEFPGGRLQALSICWDTRPAELGGQRWFHLYPDEHVDPTDPLHWTGRNQNWNSMCAECHSTNLEKRYDPTSDSYATTFSETDVSCEACHGPGSAHVAWGRARERGEAVDGSRDFGLAVRLVDLEGGAWVLDPGEDIAELSAPRGSRSQLETCSRCHSRRSASAPQYAHGRPLADTHRPALLEEGLYHADGAILDEVYVYGSFLQSKMHAAGVTCGDCHDPHSAELTLGDAEAACARCHLAATFASREHHFHEPQTAGSRCVECHMASRTYMVVDPRHDHGFRIPRPELSVEIGTPNACNDCHRDRSFAWAAAAVESWYGAGRNLPPEYLRALHAGRTAATDAEGRLAAALDDPLTPAIFRASAAALLGRFVSPLSLPALERSLGDPDPLVRAAAAGSLEALPSSRRAELAGRLLFDPVRLVRIETARALAGVRETDLTPPQRDGLSAALEEYRQEQLAAAERADAQTRLGALEVSLGNLDRAESRLERALEIDPRFVPAYVNLADVERLRGRDDLAETVLFEGLAVVPEAAALHHALGLVLVRLQRRGEALASLARAVELAPASSRYAYVYGVALHSEGQTGEALSILEKAHRAAPADRHVLWALATVNRDIGESARALGWARQLRRIAPWDPRVGELIGRLESTPS